MRSRLAGKRFDAVGLVSRGQPDRMRHDELLAYRVVGVDSPAVLGPRVAAKGDPRQTDAQVPLPVRVFRRLGAGDPGVLGNVVGVGVAAAVPAMAAAPGDDAP